MQKGTILLAAGGTGGHLFPAEALAEALKSRGYSIVLATDERANRFASNFPANEKYIIQSATLSSKNPIAVLKMFYRLFKGYRQSSAIIRNRKPIAAIGFGGYPTLPPILAASAVKIPTLIHEQNAILGRANRLLAGRVNGLAVGFAQVGKVPDVPLVETGNPVRPIVEKVIGSQYPSRKADGDFKLVVFGGSQGAQILSKIFPRGLEKLSKQMRSKFSILQQAREEDEQELHQAYQRLEVRAEIAPFFKNMPEEISKAHFVVARAGASSVSELAVIGRPSLLIPLPGSLDGDQAANAIGMAKSGGAFVVKQSDLSPERLSEILQTAFNQPEKMSEMANNAHGSGIKDAASRLADCVECVISGGNIMSLKF